MAARSGIGISRAPAKPAITLDERGPLRRRGARARGAGRSQSRRGVDRTVRIRRASARARSRQEARATVLGGARVTLGIVYHMPFWRAPDGTLRELEGSFARYVDSLASYFDEISLCVPWLEDGR